MKDFFTFIGTKIRVHLSWKKVGIALGSAVLALGVVVAPLYIFFFGVPDFVPESVERVLTEGPPLSWTPGVFTYAPGNFSLHIPSDWTFVDGKDINAPKDLGEIQFALQKNGSQCVLAYMKLNENWGDYREQSSFADRVFAGQAQIDSSWWIRSDSLPDGFEFLWEGHQSLPGEVRLDPFFYVLQSGRTDARENYFALFAQDGGTVPDQCSYEMSRILETLKGSYQKTTLTNTSTGYLLGQISDSTPETYKAKQQRAGFQSSTDGVLYELFLGGIAEGQNVTLYNNFLYYTKDANLYVQDVFSKAESRIVGSFTMNGDVINDFVISEGTIYYLLGPSCEYMNCDDPKKLYSVPVVGGVSDLLYESFVGGGIIGVDENTRTLYVEQGWGDAGCFSSTITAFDLTKKEVSDSISGGECAGDGDNTAYYAELARLDGFHANVPEYEYFSLLKVEQGKLLIPAMDDPMLDYFSPNVNFRVLR